MRTLLHPALLNGVTGDPGLWVDLLDEARSVLFDLGDLRHVAPRKLLRVERVVVTHTHMDHFVGFDVLLRLALGRERELVVTGPPGFLAAVGGRVGAYAWDRISGYPVRLRAEEVDGGTIRATTWTGAGGMRPEPLPERPFLGTLHAERLFALHAEVLDHGIPVLGAAIAETEHIAVNGDRLRAMGLVPGPWLRELKQAVRRCEAGQGVVAATTGAGGTRTYPRAELAAEILLTSPGQKIAYLTDLLFTADNVERAVRLARDADLLVCEAAFLDADAGLAAERGHLTARQAGEIGRAAGAKRLAPFHLSPRYAGREAEVFDEAAAAFGGPVLRLGTLVP